MSHSNPDLLMARCLSCGNIHGLDEVHTCRPWPLFPPHAAGEEDLIQEAREYIKADNHSPDGYAEDLVRRLLIRIPAASQAAPEMPEWVRDNIGIARSTCEDDVRDNTHDTIVWLADRVAELERERDAGNV